MQIIVSHNHLDFDGLASMVGARRLYPRAEMVFVGNLSGNVQRFMSLHKDSLPVKKVKEISLSQVDLVVVVDTNSPGRLGSLANWIRNTPVEIHLFDHHPEAAEPLEAQVKLKETIGACTTLIVEKIQEKNIKISSFEATILALGIYEDTGSLTFTTTTARDVRAVAYLLEQGANLEVVANFIELTFTDEQRKLFHQLLASVQHKTINGIDVIIASARNQEMIGNLDFVTQKLCELDTYDAFFSVVEMGKRVYVVARSRTDSLAVNEVCTFFGGGGHPKAASASIKDRRVESVLEELEQVIEEKSHPPLLARDIMSSPVKSIPMDMTLDEAGKIMLRYGHTGLPVVEKDQVVGVISRRDVDKGRVHGLGHSPVKGYMTRKVVTASPDTPVSELQYLMVKHDIGRLPIEENGQLVGIVSRTDILRTYHGQDYPEDHKILYDDSEDKNEKGYWAKRNWGGILEERLPVNLLDILKKAGNLADELGVSVYVVGGFVRDLYLKCPNFDIDLVVEGSGPDFARLLAISLYGEVQIHDRFGTAVIALPDGYHIDVVTARVEYYEYPAALPKVEYSDLKHDLYRRDFTINTMAIQLNAANFGKLVDFFGGRADLENRLIRVLYNLSFVEDPTRIIRAIRFENRFGFNLESQTRHLLEDAIFRGFLKELSAVRVKEELILLLKETNPMPGLYRLVELGAASQIIPEVSFTSDMWEMLARIPEAQEQVGRLWSKETPETGLDWFIYWMIWFCQSGAEKVSEIAEKYRFTRQEAQIMLSAYEVEEKINILEVPPEKLKMSTLHNYLHSCSKEVFIYLLVRNPAKAWWDRLLSYIEIKDKVKLEVSGNDLIKLGLKPGPQFHIILDKIMAARLDGLINTREEELALIKSLKSQNEEVSR